MTIGMIGTGRMAQALGGYLKDRSYSLRYIWGRDKEKTQKACEHLLLENCDALEALVAKSDILLLAVTDDSIRTVAEEVAACGVPLRNKWVGHFSGSLSLDVLASLAEKGAQTFSLHPLQTLPSAEAGRAALASAVFAVEAGEAFREALEAWLAPCGNTVVPVKPGGKGIYHLGACLASNYVMTLYRLAEEALVEAGIPAPIAGKALVPLMESTLENYKVMGPAQGLTGPVARGDAGTLRLHLESLQAAGWNEREPLIRALGREALHIARESGSLSEDKAAVMAQLLKGGTQS